MGERGWGAIIMLFFPCGCGPDVFMQLASCSSAVQSLGSVCACVPPLWVGCSGAQLHSKPQLVGCMTLPSDGSCCRVAAALQLPLDATPFRCPPVPLRVTYSIPPAPQPLLIGTLPSRRPQLCTAKTEILSMPRWHVRCRPCPCHSAWGRRAASPSSSAAISTKVRVPKTASSLPCAAQGHCAEAQLRRSLSSQSGPRALLPCPTLLLYLGSPQFSYPHHAEYAPNTHSPSEQLCNPKKCLHTQPC